MAAAFTVSAPASRFGVCSKGPRVETTTPLRFQMAGAVVCSTDFRALPPDAPFPHGKDDPVALRPARGTFPRGIHYTLNAVTGGVKEFLDLPGLKARSKKFIHHGI